MKPFHIGTRVRPVDGDIPNGTYRVLWARFDVVFIDFADFAFEAKGCLVHADEEGTPLGEWVPLKPETLWAWAENDGDPATINAVIRGEVEQ